MPELEKLSRQQKSHRERPVFARKGQNGVAQTRAPGAEARSLSWSTSGSPKGSREDRPGSFCKVARGPMKPSANGRSSSRIIQGLDSSMHALGHNSGPAGSTKKKTKAVPRLGLAARRTVLVIVEREAGKFATCWRSAERTSRVGEAWVGSFAG